MININRFFGHAAEIVKKVARLFRHKANVDPRFINQPAWLRAEMLDKSACKRQMRTAKRIAGVRK